MENRSHGTRSKSRAMETSILSPGAAPTRRANPATGDSRIQPDRRATPFRRTQYQRFRLPRPPLTAIAPGAVENALFASGDGPVVAATPDTFSRAGAAPRPLTLSEARGLLAWCPMPVFRPRFLRSRSARGRTRLAAWLTGVVAGLFVTASSPALSQPMAEPPPGRVLTVTLADLDEDAFDFLIGWRRGDGDILDLASRGTARFALAGGLEPGLLVRGGAVRFRSAAVSSERASRRAVRGLSRRSIRRSAMTDAAKQALRDAARRKAGGRRPGTRIPSGWRETPGRGRTLSPRPPRRPGAVSSGGRATPPRPPRRPDAVSSGPRARPRPPQRVGSGAQSRRGSPPRPRDRGSSRRRPG